MIALTATLWRWRGEGASWHFITIPEGLSGEFRAQSLLRRGGFGSVRVEVRICDPSTSSGQAVTWRTSVFPQKSGGYILPVKADVRRRAGVSADDEVCVKLEIIED